MVVKKSSSVESVPQCGSVPHSEIVLWKACRSVEACRSVKSCRSVEACRKCESVPQCGCSHAVPPTPVQVDDEKEVEVIALAPPLRPLGLRGSGLLTFALTLRLCIATVGFGDVGDALDVSYDAVIARWSSLTTLLQGTATLAGHDEGFCLHRSITGGWCQCFVLCEKDFGMGPRRF